MGVHEAGSSGMQMGKANVPAGRCGAAIMEVLVRYDGTGVILIQFLCEENGCWWFDKLGSVIHELHCRSACWGSR